MRIERGPEEGAGSTPLTRKRLGDVRHLGACAVRRPGRKDRGGNGQFGCHPVVKGLITAHRSQLTPAECIRMGRVGRKQRSENAVAGGNGGTLGRGGLRNLPLKPVRLGRPGDAIDSVKLGGVEDGEVSGCQGGTGAVSPDRIQHQLIPFQHRIGPGAEDREG